MSLGSSSSSVDASEAETDAAFGPSEWTKRCMEYVFGSQTRNNRRHQPSTVADVFIPNSDGKGKKCFEEDDIRKIVAKRSKCYAGDESFGFSRGLVERQNDYKVRLVTYNVPESLVDPVDEDFYDIQAYELSSFPEEASTREIIKPNNKFKRVTRSQTGSLPQRQTICYSNNGYFHPVDGKPLTQQMLDTNAEAIARPDKDVITQLGTQKLTSKDLQTLKDGEWLEDQVVSFYMTLILQRGIDKPNQHRKVYIFNGSFYAQMEVFGQDSVSKATEGIDLFAYDVIFFPVCPKHHWRLVVVDVPNRTITSLNSMISKFCDREIVDRIETFMEREKIRKFVKSENIDDLTPTKWTLNYVGENVPQQDNCHDCGVFILQFANYICRRKEFDFSAENMKYFRQIILHECIEKHLLN